VGPHAARRLPVDLVFPLVGRWVVLQNLSTADAAELASVWHPSLFENMLDWPDDDTPEGTRAYLRRLLRRPGIRAYVVRVRDNLAPAGITGVVDLRPVHRCAEVCCTLLLPPYRGTAVFPETMLLVLNLAFDVLHLPRVRWRTSAANLAARAALDKLGASVESFHPAADVARDGRVHDTLVYRLLHTEWPAVRDRLQRRCARAGAPAPSGGLTQATAAPHTRAAATPLAAFGHPGPPP
jgi:RimJ/RimL family protein N-acetyltransferase